MTLDQLLVLDAFAFVTSIAPGPNNLMLVASGAKFGLCRKVPHMLSVGIDFVLMVLIVGAGLARVFAAVPVGGFALKAASVGYCCSWPRLRTLHQKQTVTAAAMQMAEKKVWAQRP